MKDVESDKPKSSSRLLSPDPTLSKDEVENGNGTQWNFFSSNLRTDESVNVLGLLRCTVMDKESYRECVKSNDFDFLIIKNKKSFRVA